jgi:hypothetical protein
VSPDRFKGMVLEAVHKLRAVHESAPVASSRLRRFMSFAAEHAALLATSQTVSEAAEYRVSSPVASARSWPHVPCTTSSSARAGGSRPSSMTPREELSPVLRRFSPSLIPVSYLSLADPALLTPLRVVPRTVRSGVIGLRARGRTATYRSAGECALSLPILPHPMACLRVSSGPVQPCGA